MSFEIVDSANKRKALVEKYLKNREVLKERQLDEKISKQTFQREVATELQKPVVEQAKKVAEKTQEKTDELQDALIHQLQDNQANIIGQLGLDRNALVQALQALPAPRAQELPTLPGPAPPTLASAFDPILINPDVDLDKDIMKSLGLKLPSQLIGSPIGDIRQTKQKIATHLSSLGGKKAQKTLKPDEESMLDTLSNYNKALAQMLAASKMLPQPPKQRITVRAKPTTGQGMPSDTVNNPYKLTIDSMFGNLWIDPVKLNEFKLEAYKEGKKVLSRKMDFDLLELLTKRFNTKKDYSTKALDTFSRLIELSELPINARSLKFQVTKGSGVKKQKSVEIKYYSSPDELIERLGMIIGHKQGGGASIDLDNELVEILNKLVQDGIITNAQYEQIYNNYI